jgi:glucose 1-dehydrogenase
MSASVSTEQNPAKLKKLDDAIPLGRLARPEEIASVVRVRGRRWAPAA